MIYSNFIFYNEQLIDMCGLLKKCSTRGKQSNADHALMHHVWVKASGTPGAFERGNRAEHEMCPDDPRLMNM